MALRSDLSKFYELSVDERIKYLKKYGIDLSFKELSLDGLEEMSENVIGSYELPFSVATYFKVNGKDYLVPMVTEEKTVVAAASHGAKLTRSYGGFKAITDRLMKGQSLIGCDDCDDLKRRIDAMEERILKIMNNQSRHSEAKEIHTKILQTKNTKKLLLEAVVDTKDAMGANTITKMMESIKEEIEDLRGKYYFGIISNFPIGTTRVKTKVHVNELKYEDLNGEKIAERIEVASEFAEVNFERALTHNKGIMNGISALALATGNDIRAIESAAHGYACKDGQYRPLSRWYVKGKYLIGELEMPIPLGTVGHSISNNPKSKMALDILGVKSSKELSNVAGSVGLAQNLAALYTLVTDGISKSHKKV